MSSVPPPSRRSWPRWLRWLLAGSALAFGLLLAALLAFGLQGRWEWARTKAALIASGENFSREQFIPPPIPDKDNFFAAPIWDEFIMAEGDLRKTRFRSLTQALPPEKITALASRFPGLKILSPAEPKAVAGALWTLAKATPDDARRRQISTEILTQLAPAQSFIDELRPLLARSQARAPLDYSGWASLKVPHFAPLLTLGRFLQFRSQAELIVGQGAAARGAAELLFRVADTFSSEPFLISHMVRMTLIKLGLETVNAGIGLHCWEDEDLAAFSAPLEKIELLPALARALRCKASFFVPMFEQPFGDLRELAATVDATRNLFSISEGTVLDRFSLRAYALLLGPRELTFYQSQVRERARQLDLYSDHPLVPARIEFPRPNPDDVLAVAMHPMASISIPVIEGAFIRTLRTQTAVNLSRLACALERHRLASGRYPAKLSDLVPHRLPVVPRDVFGHEFHYKPDGESFLLWSDGWNLTDENGTSPDNPSDHRKADWTWNPVPSAPPS